MKTLVRVIALSGLLMTSSALAAQAAEPAGASRPFEATTLNLSADGQVRAAPDQATITLGVQTKADTAGAAMTQNAQRMNAVMAALRRAGIAERDIQTSNLSLEAQYTYVQNAPQQLNGYQAANDVTITVEDLARLGPAIDAVTAAGANQINGVSFGLKDPQAAEDQARLAAVKALRAKAELYAQATGYHVTRLVSLSEGGGYAPEPVRLMKPMVRAEATPVSAGELTVQISVNAVYELGR
jgi:uncharacterized protein YggE